MLGFHGCIGLQSKAIGGGQSVPPVLLFSLAYGGSHVCMWQMLPNLSIASIFVFLVPEKGCKTYTAVLSLVSFSLCLNVAILFIFSLDGLGTSDFKFDFY